MIERLVTGCGQRELREAKASKLKLKLAKAYFIRILFNERTERERKLA
jgi:hypothetical protein